MKIRIVGAMGDELGYTAAVREFKFQNPDEMIRIHGSFNPDIWRNNPYLNRGNRDSGKIVHCYSYNPDHRGSRARHSMAVMGVDLDRVEDEYPEFHFTAEELEAPIRVFRTRSPKEKIWTPLDQILPAEARGRTIAIDPGAGWVARVWPHERFEELSAALAARGFYVVQVGWQGPRPLPGTSLNLVGRLRLRDLARFMGLAELHVGNDSGLFHVAAAVGTRQAILYGVSRHAAGPYPTTAGIFPGSECHVACKDICGRPTQGDRPGHCMKEISVDQALEGCLRALRPPRPAGRLVPAPSPAEAWRRIHALAPAVAGS